MSDIKVPKVLFLGGTGYVGSCVLATLLNAHPGLDYTALVRSPEHVAHITGNHCIQGNLDDHDYVEKLASGADIVINVADNDSVPLIQAIVKGLKKRKEETGGNVSLVHTSGVLVFYEGKEGKKAGPDAKLWDDGDEESIKSISPDRPHAPVDLAILEAGSTGEITTYIVCPGMVFGQSPSGKVTNAYRIVVGGAIKSGAVDVIGEGSNAFGIVHINDLADIYLRIINKILFEEPPVTSPYLRYFIAQTAERDMKTLATGIAEQLKKHGVLPSAEVRSLTPEQAGPLAAIFGSTARIRARRACEDLGWEPAEPEWEHFVAWDVEHTLAVLRIKYKVED